MRIRIPRLNVELMRPSFRVYARYIYQAQFGRYTILRLVSKCPNAVI